MSNSIQAVRGMNDILPDQAIYWEYFEDIIHKWLKLYGYQNIRMPLLEKTELFVRSIGEVTDIVEKEMYTFTDRLNSDNLTLRPEGTASCVRAVLEHHLLYQSPQRLYYSGPMFRHERPQKGRYRQFHQIGIEAIGYHGPDIDAEHIIMIERLWRTLGLENIQLQLNTLGSNEERQLYRAKLITYLEKYQNSLDDDAKRRLYSNPLRILDSKNPMLQEIIATAPKLMDQLGEASTKHFAELCSILDRANIKYKINYRLVRGLDYYNLTVFEWITDQLGAQGTVCAGGRYDGLIGQLGGKSAPACGFAMGVERLLTLIQDTKKLNLINPLDAYLVHHGDLASTYAAKIAEILRDQNITIAMHCGGGSFKSQMKRADASGARYAIILGDNEAQSNQVSIKALREEKPQQQVSPVEAIKILGSDSQY